LTLFRLLGGGLTVFGRLPEVGERIVADLRQRFGIEVVTLMILEIEQHELGGAELVGADLGAHVEDLDITVVADEIGHLVAAALSVVFRAEHDQQRIAARGKLEVVDLLVVAEVEGHGRLRGIELLALAVAAFVFLFPLLALAHHLEQAWLLTTEVILGLGFFLRILAQPEVGELGFETRLEIAHEVVVATAKGDTAIEKDLRRQLGLGGAGELAQLAPWLAFKLQIPQEEVAIGRPHFEAAIERIFPAFAVDLAARGVFDQGGAARRQVDAREVAQIAAPLAGAVLIEVDALAVIREIEVDRRPGSPAEGIGHDPLEAEAFGLGSRRLGEAQGGH